MNAGDYVKIQTDEDSFEGTLIPRPELLGDDVFVIKLDSGYNVGIKKEKIIKSEILKGYSPLVKNEIKKVFNPNLPTIAILSFGGTISSKIDYKTGGVIADYDANDFAQMCPELENIANIKAKKVFQIMSEDVDMPTLSEMAKSIEPWLLDESIKGIVITCGTDCLHYITSALSFMITPNKPIIFTASQRSIDRGSSDAFMNLSCSVKSAVEWDGNEIVVCMHENSSDDSCILIRGTKVRKMHTSRRDAFRPINTQYLARINYPSLNFEKNSLNENYFKNNSIICVKPKISEKVAYVHVHPGINPEIIDFYISKGYDGIVLAGTALGHVPANGKSNMLSSIKKALDSGLIVVMASQTIYGRTHPFVYTTLRKLSVDLGVIFAEDTLPETAYMKLAWLLGNYSKDEVKLKFTENLKGEISEIIDEESFLN